MKILIIIISNGYSSSIRKELIKEKEDRIPVDNGVNDTTNPLLCPVLCPWGYHIDVPIVPRLRDVSRTSCICLPAKEFYWWY